MKYLFTQKFSLLVLCVLALQCLSLAATAQCSVSGTPTYSSSCSDEYYTNMTASGITVVSTISLTGGTCGSTTYFNKYATQGVTVTPGNTVSINFTRYTTTYTGYMTVYVDWNNDGTYTPGTELAGTMLTMPSSVLTATYNFLVPTTGVVTGTHLHMRVMLSEITTGAPCSASFGQTYDYYLQANCTSGTIITALPASGSVCAGGPGIPLTGSGAGTGGTYTWAPAAGLSASTGATVTATPTVTTVYTVTGIPTGGCSGTATTTVTVSPPPSATVTASGPLTLCAGDSVHLTTLLVAGSTYQWYLGSTALTGATNNTFTVLAAGSYTVKVTNASGCSATSTAYVVSVSAAVSVSDTTSGALAFCAGDSIKLRATNGAGYTYQWLSGGSPLAGATSSTYEASASGSYVCNITIPSGCTASTNAVTVTVHPLPVPVVTFDGKLFHTASNYTSYQWLRNGTNITGAIQDTTRAHSDGNYTVEVTDSNGCKATSAVYDLTNLAVGSLSAGAVIDVYPNPASSVLYIESPVSVEAVILSADGKTVGRQADAHKMDVSSLPAGMYVISLYDAQGRRLLIKKLVKN